MTKYRLNVEVEPLEDGRFLAQATNLRGCMAEGDTPAEALHYIEGVARLIIEMCIKESLPLPPEFTPGEEAIPLVRAELVVQADPPGTLRAILRTLDLTMNDLRRGSTINP